LIFQDDKKKPDDYVPLVQMKGYAAIKQDFFFLHVKQSKTMNICLFASFIMQIDEN
jgi:hypothetical protein